VIGFQAHFKKSVGLNQRNYSKERQQPHRPRWSPQLTMLTFNHIGKSSMPFFPFQSILAFSQNFERLIPGEIRSYALLRSTALKAEKKGFRSKRRGGVYEVDRLF
jgi:hypothetical protein